MYFYIFIFLIGSGLCASNVTKMNTGTVLFSELDVAKECWNPDDVALLTTRFFFEDILPDKNSLNIHDNSYVNDLVDYFRLLLDVITLRALIDVLGGYLYRYVLPTARYSYYAGYINYGSIEKLNKLFDELKCFLRTNGQGWIKAHGPCGRNEPMYYFDSRRRGMYLRVISSQIEILTGLFSAKNVEIPLPFLDSRADPSAIALPFKAHPLLEIESKTASYVLVKYYVTSMKCLHYHNANQTDLKLFTSTLYAWIENQVLPLLNNDKFYSAFGGVLRIKETLKDSIKYDADETSTGKKKSDLILTALLATIFIWFLLGSIFICYRIKPTFCSSLNAKHSYFANTKEADQRAGGSGPAEDATQAGAATKGAPPPRLGS
ncbi:hypothetical protein RI129_012667 [Pyrocoelia pectoralis]|uniref:Uncharacterized protein n=1 Tax=Pyrocoelia pectoralis TaxID=417401 RepID=A0AAN7ZCA2_9COLE